MSEDQTMVQKAFAQIGERFDGIEKLLKREKPLPYDAEIEYLERNSSNDSTFVKIPTGINSSLTTVFRAKIQNIRPHSTNGESPVVGDAWAGSRMFLEYYSSTLKWHMTNTGSMSVSINNSIPHIIEAANGRLIINGVQSTSTNLSSMASDEITLLSFRNAYAGKAIVRLFWFQIEQDGQIVRDFIPVRLETTGYLYDKISGQLFGNAGTGSFALGPDKS